MAAPSSSRTTSSPTAFWVYFRMLRRLAMTSKASIDNLSTVVIVSLFRMGITIIGNAPQGKPPKVSDCRPLATVVKRSHCERTKP